jgi:DinB superfamily
LEERTTSTREKYTRKCDIVFTFEQPHYHGGFDMNPYALRLGGRDPLEVIAATSGQLQRVAEALGPERLQQPLAIGKWSPLQIFCHLADTEVAFAFRLRQALAEDHHVIQPFDQDKCASTYMGYEARAALAVFSALREWNLILIRAVTPEALSKPVTHPERGKMTFRVLIETMAGHDLNHLQPLEAFY